MLILAQPQEIYGADFPGQSKPFRAQPNPFTGDALSLIVVIPDRQVFLEVFFCVLEVVLRLCRDHSPDNTRIVRAFCVSATFSRTRRLAASIMPLGRKNSTHPHPATASSPTQFAYVAKANP